MKIIKAWSVHCAVICVKIICCSSMPSTTMFVHRCQQNALKQHVVGWMFLKIVKSRSLQ